MYWARFVATENTTRTGLFRHVHEMDGTQSSQNGGFTLPHFKTYYEATVIRLCGIGIRVDIQINGIELRVQK